MIRVDYRDTLTIELEVVSDWIILERYFADVKRSLISVQLASEMSGYGDSHIRGLLADGKMLGVKLGRDWWTTKEAVELYQETDPRPGPKTS